MNKNITSLNQLRMEIAVMQTKQAVQEERLRNNIRHFAESFKPGNLIKNAIRSLGSDSGLKGDVTKKGMEAAVGFLISNLLLRNFGPAARTLASLAGTTVATGILGEHAGKYIDKLKHLFEKFKKSPIAEKDPFDEKDIYSQ